MVEGVIKGGAWRTLRGVFMAPPYGVRLSFFRVTVSSHPWFRIFVRFAAGEYVYHPVRLCVLFFLGVPIGVLLPVLWLCRSGLVGGPPQGR